MERRTRFSDCPPIAMCRGNDQHQSADAGISLLEHERPDLCLYVSHAAHELVGNRKTAAG